MNIEDRIRAIEDRLDALEAGEFIELYLTPEALTQAIVNENAKGTPPKTIIMNPRRISEAMKLNHWIKDEKHAPFIPYYDEFNIKAGRVGLLFGVTLLATTSCGRDEVYVTSMDYSRGDMLEKEKCSMITIPPVATKIKRI